MPLLWEGLKQRRRVAKAAPSTERLPGPVAPQGETGEGRASPQEGEVCSPQAN